MTLKRILVTGGNGFLGRHLVEALQSAGHTVTSVSRRSPNDPGTEGSRVRFHRLDLTNLDALQGLVRDVGPDVVCHLASDSRGGRELELLLPSFQNDVQATLNVLIAAQAVGCERLVMTASLEEPPSGRADAAPVSPYAAAKVASGVYGRLFDSLYGLPVTILRPFMTYGPGQKAYKLIPQVARALLKGETPSVSSGARLVDFVFVGDVIEAFVLACTASAASGHTIDLGTGVLVSIGEVVERMHALVPGSRAPIQTPSNLRGNEVERRADTGPAAELLGWRATTSLSDGLARTLAFYRHALSGEGAAS